MRTIHRSRRAALLFATTLLTAVTAYAAEIRVMTSGAFTAAFLELSTRFEGRTQDKIITAATSMGTGADSIPTRIQRGEVADVVIVADSTLDELIRNGMIVSDSRVQLARSAIGMAVRAGAPKPDIGSIDALRRALLQAKSIAYSASVSGDYLSNELFQRLGIADRVRPKSLRVERERVGAVVARGDAEIGFQQISELLPVRGIDYVGPLPPEAQRITVFSAGIVVGTKNPDRALALIRFLASPDAISAIRNSGLEPIARR